MNPPVISKSELLDLVIRAAAASGVNDPQPIEAEAFVSGLATSIGLCACKRSEQTQSPCNHLHSDSPKFFDFDELPRDTLLRQLAASSGYELRECRCILLIIEKRLAFHFELADEVEIEEIGKMFRDRGIYTLALTQHLSVTRS